MEAQNKFEFTRKGEVIELVRIKQYQAEEKQLNDMNKRLGELIDNHTTERTAIRLALKNNTKEVKVPFKNTFTLPEFLKAQLQTRNELMQLKQQEFQLKQQIEQKLQSKQLLQTQDKMKETQSILDDNNDMENEVREEIRLQIKKIVKKEKAKKGYGRIQDTKERLEVQNQILGPICNEMNIDMADKLIINIKREFDKI